MKIHLNAGGIILEDEKRIFDEASHGVYLCHKADDGGPGKVLQFYPWSSIKYVSYE